MGNQSIFWGLNKCQSSNMIIIQSNDHLNMAIKNNLNPYDDPIINNLSTNFNLFCLAPKKSFNQYNTSFNN